MLNDTRGVCFLVELNGKGQPQANPIITIIAIITISVNNNNNNHNSNDSNNY